ncbi:hypothetical protein MMC06_004601, partial [Schaereria dolodes]|nr:hypothetical protein [Schaereria dolodes]
MSDWQNQTCRVLRATLRTRGLPVSGHKAVLVVRLDADDLVQVQRAATFSQPSMAQAVLQEQQLQLVQQAAIQAATATVAAMTAAQTSTGEYPMNIDGDNDSGGTASSSEPVWLRETRVERGNTKDDFRSNVVIVSERTINIECAPPDAEPRVVWQESKDNMETFWQAFAYAYYHDSTCCYMAQAKVNQFFRRVALNGYTNNYYPRRDLYQALDTQAYNSDFAVSLEYQLNTPNHRSSTEVFQIVADYFSIELLVFERKVDEHDGHEHSRDRDEPGTFELTHARGAHNRQQICLARDHHEDQYHFGAIIMSGNNPKRFDDRYDHHMKLPRAEQLALRQPIISRDTLNLFPPALIPNHPIEPALRSEVNRMRAADPGLMYQYENYDDVTQPILFEDSTTDGMDTGDPDWDEENEYMDENTRNTAETGEAWREGPGHGVESVGTDEDEDDDRLFFDDDPEERDTVVLENEEAE